MFVYLSKKISIPNNVLIKSVAWSQSDGYMACGCDDGLLKVLRLETAGKSGISGPSNLSINQNLAGHSGSIDVVVWNNLHQKLTSSDSNGLIIVWMLHKGTWYEEMINNRDRSVVRDMAWNADGEKICIVYEDGVVIVGSVDGNRLWGKEIKGSLVAVEWTPNAGNLLFGFSNGEIHLYDGEGNFSSKLTIVCLQNVGSAELTAIYWPKLPAVTAEITPSLAIVYRHGTLQLMRHENDSDPIIVQDDTITIVDAAWNPTGTVLALACKVNNAEAFEDNLVQFYSPMGDKIRQMKVPGKDLTSCSWGASGLRIALGVDSHLYFACIRPSYKWCYCGQTTVYSYQREDRIEQGLCFWENNSEEPRERLVRDLLGIASFKDHCVIATIHDEFDNQYTLELCNSIGTPVDTKKIDIDPEYLAMNSSLVIAASKEAFYIWQFSLPRRKGDGINLPFAKRANAKEKVYHIDDTTFNTDNDIKKAFADVLEMEKTMDPICSICCSETVLLIGRDSGAIQKYSLPVVELKKKFLCDSASQKIALNCDNTQATLVSTDGTLVMFDFATEKTVPGFERKDVWDVKWDEDFPDMVAVMEKTKLYVIRGLKPEDPITTSGYICWFKDLSVRVALLDDLVTKPLEPSAEWVEDIEIKSLKNAKELLQKMSLQEAAKFIDLNPHPKLWNLLAEVALDRMDVELAEHAFVHLKDYAGIQFVKKVNNIQNEKLRKAEIAAYFKRFDDAERMYLDCDRRDLAIGLRAKLGDWFRVLQLLQTGAEAGDEEQRVEAWKAIGEYYASRQKWNQAVQHYAPGKDFEGLVDCFFMMEDYESLKKLMRQLPDNHPLLPKIAEIFGTSGLCDITVEAYTKCNQIKNALDVCIELNHWETAMSLAKTHEIPDVDRLLSKYMERLLQDSERQLTAVQLYRKAGRHLEAAKLVFTIAEERKENGAKLLQMKKIYVLGALLVEQYHQHHKDKHEAGQSGTQAALNGLLEEESASSIVDSKIIDQAWHGAEAYHFFMLAQRQLHDGNVDAAMKTSLHLVDYDDILEPVDIYSLIALASCANRQFSVCSRAFIKLESLQSLTKEQHEEYETLALSIFTKHNPKDTRISKIECTGCETLIPDHCQTCPSCDTKFPTCIVTGRPLVDYQFWLCPVCKHQAYEQEVVGSKFCPLCHVAI